MSRRREPAQRKTSRWVLLEQPIFLKIRVAGSTCPRSDFDATRRPDRRAGGALSNPERARGRDMQTRRAHPMAPYVARADIDSHTKLCNI